MYRKFLFTILFTTALLLGVSTAATAQTSPVRGEVKLKKADGTMVPFEGAVVEAYRTDVNKGAATSATTNQKGQFNFAGFQVGQTYALSVSGTAVGPRVSQASKV